MPKLNVNLIRSVVQDLNEIVDVCNEVSSWVGDIDCVSWRYPTQNCDTIHVNSILRYHTGPASECYLLLLELIYDRLHYLLNLLVKYLDMIPIISKQFNVPRNVICPRQLSLGALLNMYWQRITALHQHLSDLMVEEINNNLIDENMEETEQSHNVQSLGAISLEYVSANVSHSRSTQTQDHSLTCCESCSMSEELVKCLVMHIESKCKQNFLPSAISEQRLHMKDAIFRVSQWSAMLCWVDAILKDSDTLTDALSNLKVCNKNLKKEIQLSEATLFQKFGIQSNEITSLKNQLMQLHHNLKVEKTKYEDVLCEKKTVDSQYISVTINLKQLGKKLNESEISRQQLINSNEQMKSDLTKFTTEIGNCNNLIREEKSKCEIWETKYFEEKSLREDSQMQLHEIMEKCKAAENNFKLELEKKETMIQEVCDQNISLKNEMQELSKHLTHKQDLEEQCRQHVLNTISTNKNLIQLTSRISKLEKELQESKTRETLLLEYPDFNAPLPQKVCGDPVQDMEAQVRANQIRITLLEEQNQKLECTLKKLRILSTKH